MTNCFSLGKHERVLKSHSGDNALGNVDENSLQKSLMSPGSDSDELQQATTRRPAGPCAIYPLLPGS